MRSSKKALPQPLPAPLLLTSPQASARLGLRKQSLRARRFHGNSPPFIRLSNSPTAPVFYSEVELLAWIASKPRFTGTSEERAALGIPKPQIPRSPGRPRKNGTPAAVATKTAAG